MEAFTATDNLLKQLDPADMDPSRRTPCLENTRVDVLKSIFDWVSDVAHTQNVLWLQGLAGSGKSTISTTLANHFRDRNLLGAFLFFDRDVTERSDPMSVIKTLAYQLSIHHPRIGTFISASIRSKPSISISPIPFQCQKLLIEPLRSFAAHGPKSPIVLVLDALDECGTLHDREFLLAALSTLFSHLPPFVRVIISSRVEIDICNAFGFQTHILVHEIDITSRICSEDILSYFRHFLALIRTRGRHLRLGPDWPEEAVLRLLAQRASGLFIWASTALKFINGYDPRKRLETVLEGGTSASAEAALDALYKTALESGGSWDDEDFVADFRAIVGIILVAQQPLSSIAIDALLRLLEGRSCLHTVSQLGCLLQRSPTVRVLHPSFADFLTTNSRCGRDLWFFDRAIYHRRLALQCLDQMNAILKQNMCNMALSEDLACENLLEEVSYACVFWIDHVCVIREDIVPVAEDLCKFLYKHLLHWFEAMSILGKSRDTILLLDRLMNWITVSHLNTSLFPLIYLSYVDPCRSSKTF